MRFLLLFLFFSITIELDAKSFEYYNEAPTDTVKTKNNRRSDIDIIRIAIEKDIEIFINERNRIIKLSQPILDTLLNTVSGKGVVETYIQNGEYIEVEVEKTQVDSNYSMSFSTHDIIIVNQSFKAKREIKSKRSRGKRIVNGLLIAGGVVLIGVFFGLLSIVYF